MPKRCCNIRALLSGMLCLGLTYSASARQNTDPESNPGQRVSQPVDESGHYCRTDFSSPDARAAIAAFQEARRNDTLPRARKRHNPPDIGDERTFNVNEPDSDADPDPWKTKTFRLVDKQDVYYMWVDVDELSYISDSDVIDFKVAFLDRTPPSSINPGNGILTNNHNLFGLPPDYDQDGILDMLFYDVDGNGTTIGYVAPADIAPNLPDSIGNQADVIYLDSRRQASELAVIVAHEYTHLIHLSTGGEPDYTFVSEGYAEYAMVMNGYPNWRSIRYLNDQDEYLRPLFDWRPGGGLFARDYERANLFFSYIAEQHSPETIGQMLQNETKGLNGLNAILQLENSSLINVIKDFHTANYVNDRAIDPRFGHGYSARQSLQASVPPPINGEVKHGSEEGLCYCKSEPLNDLSGGSVNYYVFENVADINLKIDAVGYQIMPENVRERIRIEMQNRIRPRLIGERKDGSFEIFDLIASADYQRIDGGFVRLIVVVAHVDPGVAFGGTFSFEVDWTPLSHITASEDEITLPGSLTLEQNYPNPYKGQTSISFNLNRAGHVRLTVFDLLGREMELLVNGFSPAGNHNVTLNAGDWPGGTYFYRLRLGEEFVTRRMVLSK